MKNIIINGVNMNEYDYFIAGFQSSDAEYLRLLIASQAGLAPTFSDINTNGDTVGGIDGFDISVYFTAPLSGPAQTLLGGLMATYMVSVPVAKLKALAALKITVQNYIEAHYDTLTRQQFISLYMLAKFDSLTNRADYIRPGLDWLNSILAYAASTATAIQALTTLSDVQNYTVDIAGNVSADPHLTVGAAIIISD